MEVRHLLAAVGAGNTSVLLLVVGRRAFAHGPSARLPFDLLVGRVLPFGFLAGLVILFGALGARSFLDASGRDVRPLVGAYAAPGYAVPAVSAVRDASAATFPPPTSIEVALVGIASASGMYVLVWFARGPDAP